MFSYDQLVGLFSYWSYLSPPPLKNRFQPRNIPMRWNFQDMLVLEREGYHKIFSPKSLGFREIWAQQGSKMTHFASQISLSWLVQNFFFVFCSKEHLKTQGTRKPLFWISPFLSAKKDHKFNDWKKCQKMVTKIYNWLYID